MPYKLSVLHKFASDDNAECLQKAFNCKPNYSRDNMKRSPLDYAMYVKSYDCVDIILDNFFAMDLEIEYMD